jgi:hypothetical protein
MLHYHTLGGLLGNLFELFQATRNRFECTVASSSVPDSSPYRWRNAPSFNAYCATIRRPQLASQQFLILEEALGKVYVPFKGPTGPWGSPVASTARPFLAHTGGKIHPHLTRTARPHVGPHWLRSNPTSSWRPLGRCMCILKALQACGERQPAVTQPGEAGRVPSWRFDHRAAVRARSNSAAIPHPRGGPWEGVSALQRPYEPLGQPGSQYSPPGSSPYRRQNSPSFNAHCEAARRPALASEQSHILVEALGQVYVHFKGPTGLWGRPVASASRPEPSPVRQEGYPLCVSITARH